jgi:hypothetical protein
VVLLCCFSIIASPNCIQSDLPQPHSLCSLPHFVGLEESVFPLETLFHFLNEHKLHILMGCCVLCQYMGTLCNVRSA